MIPTGVPLAAPSATLLAAALLSTGSEGATLLTLMVNEADELRLPSLACTVMVWLVADSKLSSLPLATVTTPVVGSMAKRPPALSVRL